jgi:diketogulonate reductase-like aldo/keto reductase
VSNFDTANLEAIWQAGGEGHLACNQVLYHLKERAIEHAVLPWCRAKNVSVVAYSPFGSGDFPAPSSAGGKILQQVADRHDATPFQIALQFLLRDPAMFVIPKASTALHAAENAAAANVALSNSDVDAIDHVFPLGRAQKHLPML